MNDRFTQRVRKVLFLARDEAGRLQHDYIGTEHLLLGIIREGEGIAANVLRRRNEDAPAPARTRMPSCATRSSVTNS